MTAPATSALYEGGRTYVAPMSPGNSKPSSRTHEPGRREQQWEVEVREGKTRLTFEAWMREKGWR